MAKKVRSAKTYQPKDAPLRQLSVQAKPGIRRDLRASLVHLGTLLDAKKAADLIRAGLPARVYEAVDIPHFREVLKVPFAKIGRLRLAAAHLGVRKINGAFHQRRQRVRFHKLGRLNYVPPGGGAEIIDLLEYLKAGSDGSRAISKDIGDRFNFDMYSESTQARIRAAQDELIQQLAGDVRSNVYTIVMDGARQGRSADAIVDDIRMLVGLTDRQSQAVLNFRSKLESLSYEALTRQLRDPQYDDAIRAAIDSETPLDSILLDQMVGAYRDNYLDYRAATIAQTESIRAASAGLQDSYGQAIDRGVLPSDAVRQFWQVSLNENVCPVCLSIPDMNPDGVAIGEDFDSIDGPQEAPPDPHPNCECGIDIVTDIDKVPDTTEEDIPPGAADEAPPP